MSQRKSGYDREDHDKYETPAWVTLALVPYLRDVKRIWEPAAGSGKMVSVLADRGFQVDASDIAEGRDFLVADLPGPVDGIVTNPPFKLATEFITRALKLTQPSGMVAMLLRTDFDHAASRRHLFGECPSFAGKVCLTKRITWFDGPKAAPSFNHAWFLWDWRSSGPPILAYA